MVDVVTPYGYDRKEDPLKKDLLGNEEKEATEYVTISVIAGVLSSWPGLKEREGVLVAERPRRDVRRILDQSVNTDRVRVRVMDHTL